MGVTCGEALGWSVVGFSLPLRYFGDIRDICRRSSVPSSEGIPTIDTCKLLLRELVLAAGRSGWPSTTSC